jgi:hypothetical protein
LGLGNLRPLDSCIFERGAELVVLLCDLDELLKELFVDVLMDVDS